MTTYTGIPYMTAPQGTPEEFVLVKLTNIHKNDDEIERLTTEVTAKDNKITFLKKELNQLANFNPDWDMLEAAQGSLREHMATIKRLSAEGCRSEKLVARLLEKVLDLTEHARYRPFNADHVMDQIDAIDWECRHFKAGHYEDEDEVTPDSGRHEPKLGCDYQGQEFGAANYPDSVCVEGYLWDADSGESTDDGWMYDIGGDIPCPQCNSDEYAEYYDDTDDSKQECPESPDGKHEFKDNSGGCYYCSHGLEPVEKGQES